MLEGGGDLGLPLEALDRRTAEDELEREDLESYLAVEIPLPGEVDEGHPAPAEERPRSPSIWKSWPRCLRTFCSTSSAAGRSSVSRSETSTLQVSQSRSSPAVVSPVRQRVQIIAPSQTPSN
jgi:hypothetical protein